MKYFLLIYPLAIIVMFVLALKKRKVEEDNSDFFTEADSNSLKGVLALLVVVCQMVLLYTNGGDSPKGPITYLNATTILWSAVFFFIAGYGVYVRLLTKENYMKNFMLYRVAKLFIPFFIMNVAYAYMVGVEYGRVSGLKYLLASALGIAPISAMGWFVVELLILYVVFYLLYRKNSDHKKALCKLWIVVGIIMIASFLLKHDKSQVGSHILMGEWWYNSIYAFPLGITFAMNKDKVVKYLEKKYKIILSIGVLAFAGFFVLSQWVLNTFGYYKETIIYSGYGEKAVSFLSQVIVVLLFLLLLVLLMIKFNIKNYVLDFIGNASFYICIMIDILYITFEHFFSIPEIILFAVVIGCAIILAKAVEFACGFIFDYYENYSFYRRQVKENGYNDVTYERKAKFKIIFRRVRIVYAALLAMFGVTIALYIIDAYKNIVQPIEEYNEEIAAVKELKVGDSFLFGRYDTDTAEDVKERIEWIVLDVVDGKALIMSKYGLFASAYNREHEVASWDKATLNDRLDVDFYYESFSKKERAMILADEVGDNISLLSIADVNKYLTNNDLKLLLLTKYAITHDVNVNAINGNSWYWLKDDASSEGPKAYVVESDGQIVTTYVNYARGAVRPVMWVDMGQK